MKNFTLLLFVILLLSNSLQVLAQEESDPESFDWLNTESSVNDLFSYKVIISEEDLNSKNIFDAVMMYLPSFEQKSLHPAEGYYGEQAQALIDFSRGMKSLSPVILVQYGSNQVALQYFRDKKNVKAILIQEDKGVAFVNPSIPLLTSSDYNGEYAVIAQADEDDLLMKKLLLIYLLLNSDDNTDDGYGFDTEPGTDSDSEPGDESEDDTGSGNESYVSPNSGYW